MGKLIVTDFVTLRRGGTWMSCFSGEGPMRTLLTIGRALRGRSRSPACTTASRNMWQPHARRTLAWQGSTLISDRLAESITALLTGVVDGTDRQTLCVRIGPA